LYVLFMRVQGRMKHKIDMPGTRESKELENKSDALPLGDARWAARFELAMSDPNVCKLVP